MQSKRKGRNNRSTVQTNNIPINKINQIAHYKIYATILLFLQLDIFNISQ